MSSPIDSTTSRLDQFYQSIIEAQEQDGRLRVDLSQYVEFVGTVDIQTLHSLLSFFSIDANLRSKITNQLLESALDLANDIGEARDQMDFLSQVNTDLLRDNLDKEKENRETFNDNQRKVVTAQQAIEAYNETVDEEDQIELPSDRPEDLPDPGRLTDGDHDTLSEAVQSYNSRIRDYNDAVDDADGINNEWNDAIRTYNQVSGEDPLARLQGYNTLEQSESLQVNPSAVSRNSQREDVNEAIIESIPSYVDGNADGLPIQQKVRTYNERVRDYNSQLQGDGTEENPGINAERSEEGLAPLPLLEEIPTPVPSVNRNIPDGITYPANPDLDDLEQLNEDIDNYNAAIQDHRDNIEALNQVIVQLNQGVEVLTNLPDDFYPDINQNLLRTNRVINVQLEPLENFYNTIPYLEPTGQDLASGEDYLSVSEMVELVDEKGIEKLNAMIDEFNTLLDTEYGSYEFLDLYSSSQRSLVLLADYFGLDSSVIPPPLESAIPQESMLGLTYKDFILERIEIINDHIDNTPALSGQVPLITLDENNSTESLKRAFENTVGRIENIDPNQVPEFPELTLNNIAPIVSIEETYRNHMWEQLQIINDYIDNTPGLPSPPNHIPKFNEQASLQHYSTTELEDLYNSYMDPSTGHFAEKAPGFSPDVEGFSKSSLDLQLRQNKYAIDLANTYISSYNDWAEDYNNALGVLNHPEMLQLYVGTHLPQMPTFTGYLHTAPEISPPFVGLVDTEAGANMIENFDDSRTPFSEDKQFAKMLEVFGPIEEEELDELLTYIKKLSFKGTAISIDSPGAMGSLIQGAKSLPLVAVGALLGASISRTLLRPLIEALAVPSNSSFIQFRSPTDGSDGVSGAAAMSFEELGDQLTALAIQLLEETGAEALPFVLLQISTIFGDFDPEDPSFSLFFGLKDLEGALNNIQNGFVTRIIEDFFATQSRFIAAKAEFLRELAETLSPLVELQTLHLAIQQMINFIGEDPRVFYDALGEIAKVVDENEKDFSSALTKSAEKVRDEYEEQLKVSQKDLSDEDREDLLNMIVGFLFGPSPLPQQENNDGTTKAERLAELYQLLPGGPPLEPGQLPGRTLSAVEIIFAIHHEINNQFDQVGKDRISAELFTNSIVHGLINDSVINTLKSMLPNDIIIRRGSLQTTSSEDPGSQITANLINASGL